MSVFAKLGKIFENNSSNEDIIIPVEAEKLAAAALMVEVAVKDGNFSETEKEVIKNIIVTKFKIPVGEANELLDQAVEMQENSIQILSFTKKIKNHFDEEGRCKIMEMLWRVVFADGIEDDYENNLMRRIAGLLYISDKKNGEIRKKIMLKNNIL